MNNDVLNTPRRFLRQFQIQPDSLFLRIAGPPSGSHLPHLPLFYFYPNHFFPNWYISSNDFIQFLSIEYIHDILGFGGRGFRSEMYPKTTVSVGKKQTITVNFSLVLSSCRINLFKNIRKNEQRERIPINRINPF